MDMFVRGTHFRIEKTHPNFGPTNLKRVCYANSDAKHTVSISALGRCIGRLEDDLLEEFQQWYG